jgi:hypothetical protein
MKTTTTRITYLGVYDIIVSSTGRVYLTDEGGSVVVEGPFASVRAAKNFIEDEWLASEAEYDWLASEAEYDVEYEAYLMEPPACPICDAWGCGGDGGGCYRYEGRGEIADPRDYAEAF